MSVVCFNVCNIFTCFLQKQERINFILSWHKLIPTQPGQNDWFLGFKIKNTAHFIGLTQTTIEIDVPQVAFFCRGVSDEKGLWESLQLGLIKMSLIAFSCKEHELTFSFLFTFIVWVSDGFSWKHCTSVGGSQRDPWADFARISGMTFWADQIYTTIIHPSLSSKWD